MDDASIVALYLQRSQEAIAQTQVKYGPYCFRIALNLLSIHEDAQECCNDTYHAAWNQIPPDKPQRLPGYLGRITRNIAISRYRASHAQKRYAPTQVLLSELDDCVPSPETPEMVLEARELAQLISNWLDTLQGDDRALFVRRYWYGDAVQALAKETGETPNQTAKRLHRLRRSLRGYLEAKGVSI